MRAQPIRPLVAGDDAEMEQLLAQSASALTQAGLTAQDFLAALPDIRAEVRRELYDQEYLEEIERRVLAYRQGMPGQSPRVD